MTQSRFVSAVALVVFLLLALAMGFAAGLATEPNIAGWYSHLNKPSFNPPNWVFAPVWTTLYILMAIAAWRVWRVAGFESRPLLYWFVQLALNFAWSFIFFGAHHVAFALIEIAVLWLMIVLTTASFFRRDRLAGWLLVPYLVWVSFAGVLNTAIWRLNP